MIGWLREFWPWVAGAGVPLLAIVALALLNPAAALKLASSIAGWLLDLARGVFVWLRKPRTGEEKWRLVCMTMGCACLIASFVAWDARQTIVVIREKCAAEVKSAQGLASTAQDEARGAKYEVKSCRVALKTEIGKREEIERAGKEATAAAATKQAKAEKSAAEWQRRYEQRPKGCDDALMEVQQQCSTVRDY